MSQGNAEFADFFAASWDPCLRAVAASTGSMMLAEDQVAEAFARAWASWHKVSRHPAPRAWVVRTALNAGAADEHGQIALHAREYATLDRASRIQLPREMTRRLRLRHRVQLQEEPDHIGVWPDLTAHQERDQRTPDS